MEFKGTLDQACLIEAIIYIQSHEGLDCIKAGDTIRYASGNRNSWSEVEREVKEADLALASAARDGSFRMPQCAAAGRCAYRIPA